MAAQAAHSGSDLDEIIQLTFDYAIALDTKRWDDLAACFSADGILRTRFVPEPLQGHEAIKEWMNKITAEIVGNLHQTTNHQYITDAETASGTCMFVAYQWIGDSMVPGNLRVHAGRYEDHLVRVDGLWRFKNRLIDLQCQRVF